MKVHPIHSFYRELYFQAVTFEHSYLHHALEILPVQFHILYFNLNVIKVLSLPCQGRLSHPPGTSWPRCHYCTEPLASHPHLMWVGITHRQLHL